MPIEDVSSIDLWKLLPLYKGMAQEKPIRELINHWKPRRLLAEEIGANLEAVHKWAKANRIPPDWQSDVIKAAQRAGMDHVNGDWMVDAHKREASA